MTHDTCTIEECERPRYQSRKMCASHFMKAYRYGDPHYRTPSRVVNIVGQRFGLLTVEARDGRNWVCRCDCGSIASIPAGRLNRGQATCGDRSTHRREPEVGYSALHQRLEADRGLASSHTCVDCGNQAAHWSYNNVSADERCDESTGLAYSLDQRDYAPRCVPCHSRFDAPVQRVA